MYPENKVWVTHVIGNSEWFVSSFWLLHIGLNSTRNINTMATVCRYHGYCGSLPITFFITFYCSILKFCFLMSEYQYNWLWLYLGAGRMLFLLHFLCRLHADSAIICAESAALECTFLSFCFWLYQFLLSYETWFLFGNDITT